MGVINQASNLIDRVVRLEKRVNEIWHKIGLTAATISKGGLTLINDAFLRMLDDAGIEILYFGPDSNGKQMIRIRREGGADVLFTYTASSGRQFWALTDGGDNIIASDDAISGQGLARPSIPVPVRAMRFDQLPSAPDTNWTSVVGTGWFFKQQPLASVQMISCSTASDTSGEVRLLLDDVQVGSVISVAFGVNFTDFSRFALPGNHMSQHKLELQVRRIAGTGRVGADMVIRQEQS